MSPGARRAAGRVGEARDSRWRAALNVGIRRRYLSLHLFTEYNSNKFNKGEGNVWQMHEPVRKNLQPLYSERSAIE